METGFREPLSGVREGEENPEEEEDDGEQISFGKKNVGQLLDLLHKVPG